MRLKHVFIAAFGLAAVCPTQGWSQTADVFPNFGADKEVVSGVDEEFRGVGECTTFVYAISGIPNKVKVNGAKTATTMGNACEWISNATKRGYQTSPNPKQNSVGVINAWPALALWDAKKKQWVDDPKSPKNDYGHVYWVTNVDKSGSTYQMKIKHDNWPGNPGYAVYKGDNYKYSNVQINASKGIDNNRRWLQSLGFITKW